MHTDIAYASIGIKALKCNYIDFKQLEIDPDSNIHGANMGPTWVLSAPDGPHDGPLNLAIGGCKYSNALNSKAC